MIKKKNVTKKSKIICNLNQRLATKFYLYSIGLYGTVAGVFGLLYLLEYILGLNRLILIFIAYFITVSFRSLFNQLLIDELKIEDLNIKNNLTLAFISSCIFAVLYHFIRTSFGDWSIPITVILAMKINAKIKNYIWPNSTEKLSDFFKIYSQKLQHYIWGLYGFFISIALITYQIIKIYGISYFYFAFAAAIFIGLIAEQIYDLVIIYKIKPTIFSFILLTTLATVFSIFCSLLVFILMQQIKLSGKAATIIGIIIIKLIQPLIFNKFLKSK